MSNTVFLLPLWGRSGWGPATVEGAPIPTFPQREKEQGLGAHYEP
jgi:hypothetical protein